MIEALIAAVNGPASDFKRASTAGMVMVNTPTAGIDFHVPFGGRKHSSYGPASRDATPQNATRPSRQPIPGRADQAGDGARIVSPTISRP